MCEVIANNIYTILFKLQAKNCPLYHVMSRGSCQISPSNPLAHSLQGSWRMYHYPCRSEVGYSTTTQSRQCNLDISSAERISRTRRACVCQSESANSSTAHVLVDLCMMLLLCVCGRVCVEAWWLSERLRPWQRLINSGGHWGCQLSHPPLPQSL